MKKILKFSATWCGPCKMLAATIKDVDLGVPVEDIDADEHPYLIKKYAVRGVPTMVLLDGETEVARLVGMKTLEEIKEFANK